MGGRGFDSLLRIELAAVLGHLAGAEAGRK